MSFVLSRSTHCSNGLTHSSSGVFDGHGIYGHKVAAFVADVLPKQIRRHLGESEDIVEVMSESFAHTSEALFKSS